VSSHLAAAASRAGHTRGAAQLPVPQGSSKPQGSPRLLGRRGARDAPGGRLQGAAVEVKRGALQTKWLAAVCQNDMVTVSVQ